MITRPIGPGANIAGKRPEKFGIAIVVVAYTAEVVDYTAEQIGEPDDTIRII